MGIRGSCHDFLVSSCGFWDLPVFFGCLLMRFFMRSSHGFMGYPCLLGRFPHCFMGSPCRFGVFLCFFQVSWVFGVLSHAFLRSCKVFLGLLMAFWSILFWGGGSPHGRLGSSHGFMGCSCAFWGVFHSFMGFPFFIFGFLSWAFMGPCNLLWVLSQFFGGSL